MSTEKRFATIALRLLPGAQGEARVDDGRVIGGVNRVSWSAGRWAKARREIGGPRKSRGNRYMHRATGGICSRPWPAPMGRLSGR